MLRNNISRKFAFAFAIVATFLISNFSNAQSLIDVDFGAGTSTSEVGPAAVGQSPTDFWNFYTRDDGHGGWLTLGALPNLKYADGSSSAIGLVVINCPGAWGNGSSDAMYNDYIYPASGNATLNVTNMPGGNYDFYLYGHDAKYQITVGGADYGSKTTTNAPIVNPVVWQEGRQYVVIRNVSVPLGGTGTITVRPGVGGAALISGLQITQSSGSPSNTAPVITSQPSNTTVGTGSNATFSVLSSGSGPFSYQWFFNGSPIGGASSFSLTLTNAQNTNAGNYNAIVSNAYGTATSSVATLTVTQFVPSITTQPQSQTVSSGAGAAFSVAASGAPTLRYQWLFNGSSIAGASRSSFAISSAQPANSGNYSVRVFNTYGSLTSSIAVLTVSGVAPSIVSQPANQSVSSGSNVTMSVSASGSTPLSYFWRFNGSPIAGATSSILTLNNIQTNQSGNYSVLVSNFVSTATSANAVLTVLRANHAPLANPQSVAVSYNSSASIMLSASDSDNDPLAYSVTSGPTHGTLTGTPPNLSYLPGSNYSGADSFTFTANDGSVDSAPATITLNVLADQALPLIDLDFGAGPATTKTGPAATGRTAQDFWNFYTRDDANGNWISSGGLAGLKTVQGVSTAAGLTVDNAPGAWGDGSDDPMYNSYIYPFDGGNITVAVTNLPGGQYDFYVYGIDSSYQIKVGSMDYGTKSLPNGPISNPVVWQEGLQFVAFRNIQAISGQPVSLTVRPGAGGYATISGVQIASVSVTNHVPVANAQSVTVSQDGTKSITLSGSDLDGDNLVYSVTHQPTNGILSGTPPNLTYTPNAGYSGSDSLSFKVNDGVLDSAPADVTISVMSSTAKQLLSVDFGAGTTGPKTGLAAAGHSTNDYWAFYSRDDGQGGWSTFGALSNIRTVEGGLTMAGLTVANAPGAWGNGSADPMYNSYIYPFSGNAIITITNLDPGAYDLYVYGFDASYEVSVGGLSYGVKPLPNGPIVNPVVWQENLQYALFHAVQVAAGTPVVITVRPGSGGYATLSGLQVAQVDAPPAIAPSIVQQPSSQSVAEGSDVTFTVGVSGTSPFQYQWRKNGGVIAGATSNSLSVHHVASSNAATFSVTVSNSVGGVTSADAVLSVTPVNHRPIASAQSLVMAQNASTAITLAGSDSDGDVLTFVVVAPPAHGTLSGTVPNVTYHPSANFSGSDAFTFKVNDGQLDSATATIGITVLSDLSKTLIDVDFGAGTNPGPNDREVGPAATGQGANDFWNFYTRDDGYGNWLSFGAIQNLKFADQTVSSSGLTVANGPGAWGNGSADKMYNSYIYPFNGGNVTVTVTNLSVGQYDLYVYGIDSFYQLVAGGIDYGTKPLPNGPVANPVVWQEGLQFVVFRNVVISGGHPLVLTAKPGTGGYAIISGLQIASVNQTNHVPIANAQSLTTAQDTSKTITLTGSDLDGDPLTYAVTTLPAHGTLSGSAPNLTYTPLAGFSGSDSFKFKVNDGQVDSSDATVNLSVSSTGAVQLIDVDFGGGAITAKTGFAAVGQTSNDFWNFYTRDDGHGGWLTFGSVSNLKSTAGIASGAGLTVANAPGAWGNGSADPMYNDYIYPFSGNATITLTNLGMGGFDLYIYGIDGNYQVSVDSINYGNKSTTNAPVANPVVWREGEQYVVFRGIQITNVSQNLVLTVSPGSSGYAIISGLQIAGSSTENPPPATNAPPAARAVLLNAYSSPNGDTNLLVLSSNGSNAPVTLDGSLSSDADNDPLNYSWLEGSLSPFATGVATTNIMSLGLHNITLVVSDGKATKTTALQFEVISSADAIMDLSVAVEQSPLDRATKRQLQTVLLDNPGNSDVANLEAFKGKVANYVAPINPGSAAVLGAAAQQIIDSTSKP